ncbi:hypothetical protein EC973_005698 [Apophysomyces ossiformis]|uniref:SH3 domain-containing protein n=1 Tax=Apophysomyces ossiformis TaxID=679940 RepID=A0A8H7BRE1_9FUNG|nr:hypothetical protein EC973_005698 [Apophysomyces ossiformis]
MVRQSRADYFTFKEYSFDEDQRIYSRLADISNSSSTAIGSNKMAVSPMARSPMFTQLPLKPDTPSWSEAQAPTEEFHLVIHPYTAQLTDELVLQIGDVMYLSAKFDDGWALGYNVATGLKGVFPSVCTVPAPAAVVDELMLGETSSKTQLELGKSPLPSQGQVPSQQQDFALRMARMRDNLQRSRSLGILSKPIPRNTTLTYHNTIPKRTASIRMPAFSDVTPMSNAFVRPRNMERVLVQTQKPDEVYELH